MNNRDIWRVSSTGDAKATDDNASRVRDVRGIGEWNKIWRQRQDYIGCWRARNKIL
jgi:hypothetical protein